MRGGHQAAVALIMGVPEVGTDKYAERLYWFAKQYSMDVWTGKEITCLHRLENPHHVPISRDCREMPVGIDHGRNIESPIWLRRGPPGRPRQWALLSQVHAPYTDPGGTAIRIGEAPVLHGRQGLLYLGRYR
jgi:hypothetical protein